MLNERITTSALALVEAIDRTLEINEIVEFSGSAFAVLEITRDFLWDLLLTDVDSELEGSA